MKDTSGLIIRSIRSGLFVMVFVGIGSGYINSPPLHNLPVFPSSSNKNAVLTSRPHQNALQAWPTVAWLRPSTEPTSIDASHQATEVPFVDVVTEMLAEVDRAKVLNDLMQLTGEVPLYEMIDCCVIPNRLTGRESLFLAKGLDMAKGYVRNRLTDLGYSVEAFEWSDSGFKDQNLIARKTGLSLPNEEIYFVAHMDGVAPILQNMFPAADDNASGVVDLLELARVLNNYSFHRTVVLFFSTGEEQGKLGVQTYLSQVTPEELSSIKYVVNIDMIGYDANQDRVMELVYGGHVPSLNLAELFSATIRDYQINLVPLVLPGCG